MTPYSLAFYVDVVTTAGVLGVGPADSPERVTEVLGPDFAENVSGGRTMWRDYGLAEFFWGRASSALPWSGSHVSLQVHRLAYRDPGLVNEAIRAQYGRFTPRLRFEKLRRLLEHRGVPLLEVPELPANSPHFRTYWQPASRVAVSVVGTCGEYSTPRNLRVGDVYKIQSPVSVDEVEWRRARVGADWRWPG
ncbi:hypothetical protein [Streptomyces sp. NPDC048200]|uniref:hypothetical protein n=1 Tax=Streptomyces sp. NPDC048200 TaxID=3365512 RepID=UPI003720DC6C